MSFNKNRAKNCQKLWIFPLIEMSDAVEQSKKKKNLKSQRCHLPYDPGQSYAWIGSGHASTIAVTPIICARFESEDRRHLSSLQTCHLSAMILTSLMLPEFSSFQNDDR